MYGKVYPYTAACLSMQRSTLILTFLLDHERLAEDTSVILLLHNRLDRQLSLRSIDHRLVDEDDVIDIPCAPVGK